MSAAPNEMLPTSDENSSQPAADKSAGCGTEISGRCRSQPEPPESNTVTLRAQCHACSTWFDLSQLYGADPTDADRCPACTGHLGAAGLGHMTFRIERHLQALRQAIDDLAAQPGAFTVDSTAVRGLALDAIDRLDEPPDLHTSTRVSAAA